MSIKKWEAIAQQKRIDEAQTQRILNAFKERKIKDEMGGLAAEKLFRPITKRLTPEESAERRLDLQLPDYAVDDETLNWDVLPFNEDAEEEPPEGGPDYGFPEEDILQEKSLLDSEDETLPGGKQDSPVGQASRLRSASTSGRPPPYSLSPPSSPPPAYPKGRRKDQESVDLSTLKKFLKNNKRNPDAVVSTPKSKFYGWNKNMVEDEVYRIYSERAKEVLQKKSIGQKNLGPFAGKSRRQIRDMLGIEGKTAKEVQQMEWFADDSKEDIQKMFGLGLNSLINRLYLGIASLHAGNFSAKLKKEIQTIADHLLKSEFISR